MKQRIQILEEACAEIEFFESDDRVLNLARKAEIGSIRVMLTYCLQSGDLVQLDALESRVGRLRDYPNSAGEMEVLMNRT